MINVREDKLCLLDLNIIKCIYLSKYNMVFTEYV
jgi:hypothetical protein